MYAIAFQTSSLPKKMLFNDRHKFLKNAMLLQVGIVDKRWLGPIHVEIVFYFFLKKNHYFASWVHAAKQGKQIKNKKIGHMYELTCWTRFMQDVEQNNVILILHFSSRETKQMTQVKTNIPNQIRLEIESQK